MDRCRIIRLVAIIALLAPTLAWVGADPSPVTAANTFTDIGTSMFRGDIEWAAENDITGGCTTTRFCPESLVTREQMASFLTRMFDVPTTTTDFFDDDAGSIHEGAINRIAAAGITGGCATDRYCPKAPVTRQQMASFITRAAQLTEGIGRNYFYDDNGSAHEADIDRLAAAGVGSGCAEWRFCPRNSVTRGQMAAFLHRVVAPKPPPPHPAPPPPSPTPAPSIPSPPPDPSKLRFEPTPKLQVPDYRSTITDPVWKTQITRISDHAGVRHTYSRRQAWNRDGSLLLLGMGAGRPRMLLDGRTYQVLNRAVRGDGLWSETDPGLLIRTNSSTGEVFTFNPLTNRKTSTIVSLAKFNHGSQLQTMTQSSLDDSGRFLLLYGATADARKKVIVLDLETKAISTLDVATRPHAGSISHSGGYVALNWDAVGLGRERGIWLYDINLRAVRQIASSKAHSDFAYDTSGGEVLVWIGELGSVRMHRLSDGAVTIVLEGGTAMKRGHISGRNSDRPGWVYCSIYDSIATNGLSGSDQIFALKLDGSQTVEVIAHAHHGAGSYHRDPMASVSRDGRRVLFASEWGESDVYAYVATQPRALSSATTFSPQ